MLDAIGEGHRKDLWIGNTCSNPSAPVRKVSGGEPVDPGSALVWIELGGILQVLYPAFVHLLGDPAFVPDMGVPAALVERGDDALDVGRAITCRRQPRTIGLVL